MSEALARVRNDSILVQPAKRSSPGLGLVRRLAKRAVALPVRFYIGAAFSALLAGIAVNALLLQRERHPAPLFAPSHPRTTPRQTIPLPPQPPGPAPADAGPVPRPSVGSPQPKPAIGENATVGSTDQIGELLRGNAEPRSDVSRTIVAAQAALARLGYPVKADGVEGAATEQALHEFQRTHGLPLTSEITPHLVKQLTIAARAGGQ
jgi:hypothetical protein